mgnify:CR=1 FL=1
MSARRAKATETSPSASRLERVLHVGLRAGPTVGIGCAIPDTVGSYSPSALKWDEYSVSLTPSSAHISFFPSGANDSFDSLMKRFAIDAIVNALKNPRDGRKVDVKNVNRGRATATLQIEPMAPSVMKKRLMNALKAARPDIEWQFAPWNNETTSFVITGPDRFSSDAAVPQEIRPA